MSISRWLSQNTHSLCGKTVAVSGSTGGLGNPLCEHLARLGASLILLDRNMEKSRALAARLTALLPTLSVTHIQMDLECMESVENAADRLKALEPDYLILNAGAYSIPRHTCSTGYDNVFQINFVSPYYLARQLLPTVSARGGKIIAVGSIAHTYSHTDPEDVDFSKRKKASLVYGNAKRYLMASLPALPKGDSSVATVHPGITFTNITAHYPPLIFALIKHPMKVIFMSPKKASLCILAGLFTDCAEREWIGPRLLDVWGLPRKKKLTSISKEEADAIRSEAERIYRAVSR